MDKDMRRLVFTAVGLLVTLFLGRAIIGSVWDDAGMRRSVEGVRRSLSGSGAAAVRPAPGDEGLAAELVDRMRDELELFIPQLGYERPEQFAVPAEDSPDLRYIEVQRREQDALVRGARFVGKSVPLDLGMPAPNPTVLEDVLSALRALHIVQRVVTAGLESDVLSVDGIRVPPDTRRGAAGSGFLRQHRVEFDLVGTPASIHATLVAVVGGQPYLALDDVRIEALDEDGERVRCRMSVAALTVDAERSALDGASGAVGRGR